MIWNCCTSLHHAHRNKVDKCNPLDPAIAKGKQFGSGSPSNAKGAKHNIEHTGVGGGLYGRHQQVPLGHCFQSNPDSQVARQKMIDLYKQVALKQSDLREIGVTGVRLLNYTHWPC